MKTEVKHDIVKDSNKLKKALLARWKECGLTQAAVSEDALDRGQIGITRQAINRYIKDPYAKGALNQQQIVWLSWRWLVPVTLSVGIPDSKVNHVVPEKFDEKKALTLLNKAFAK